MKKNSFIYFILFIVCLFIYIPNVNAMKINIEKTDGNSFELEVESSDTIEAVKSKIYDKESIDPINQKLIFNSKELEDGRTLADYEIKKENTIYLILILNEENFKVIFDGNGGLFENNNETLIIDEWKIEYADNLKIPVREGYSFKGFYTDKTGGTKFENYFAEAGIDKDMTFYARWEENIENPETLDNINISIFMIIVSVISLIGLTCYLIIKNKKILKQ